MSGSGGNKLVVFVKAPVPGQVKTRLARAIGEDLACAAYRELAGRVVENLSELREVELRFAPDDAGSEIDCWLRDTWVKAPQGGGDLGDRLGGAFREKFEEGAGRVVIIGSDCPHVTAEDIREAWKVLDECDVVLGPARDGGYWLIGLRTVRDELFCDVPWSGPAVLRTTTARAAAAGLSVGLLRELSDVDDEQDWRRFREGVLF